MKPTPLESDLRLVNMISPALDVAVTPYGSAPAASVPTCFRNAVLLGSVLMTRMLPSGANCDANEDLAGAATYSRLPSALMSIPRTPPGALVSAIVATSWLYFDDAGF